MTSVRKKVTERIISILFLLFTAVSVLSPLKTLAASNSDFTLQLEAGFDGKVQPGYHAPFTVTVKNNGSDFEGSVQLLLGIGNDDIIAYEQKVSISAGTTKTFKFTAYIGSSHDSVCVRIVNNKDKIITSKDFPITSVNVIDSANIAILSDDYTAFNYLSRKTFHNSSEIKLSLKQFDADSFPETAKALELFDAIIISNFSTDALSGSQLSALLNSVSSGRLLIVGTGDSASKTLSGLEKRLPVATGDLKERDTDFGFDNIDFTYDYVIDNGSDYFLIQNYYMAYTTYTAMYDDIAKCVEDRKSALLDGSLNKTVMEEVCRELYMEYESIILDNCWEIQYGESYSLASSGMYYDAYTLANYKKDFEYFCVYTMLPQFVNYYISNDLNNGMQADKPADRVIAPILDIDYGQACLTDTDADGNSFVIAGAADYGLGKICVTAVDLTKSPFVDYSENATIVVHLIELFTGQQIANRYMNYGMWNNNYNYDQELLFNKLSSQKLIPFLVYVLILFGYTVTVFVLYFRLRKKNKSMLLWPITAGLSLAVAFVIFLIGFSTRLGSYSINTAKIVTDINGSASEKVYSTVVMPNVRHYEIPFSNNYNVSFSSNETRSYYSGGPIDFTTYDFCFSDEPEGPTVKLDSDASMSVKNFELETKSPEYSGVDLQCEYNSGALFGTVTNNSDKVIEDSVIFVDFAFFKIGDIAPGETINLSDKVGESILIPELCDGSKLILKQLDFIYDYKPTVSQTLFGVNSRSFKSDYNRYALFSYLQTDILGGVQGFGDYYGTYYSWGINGGNSSSYKDIRILTLDRSNTVYMTAEETLAKYGFTPDGFCISSSSKPVFFGFKADSDSVLRKKNNNEYVTEAVIVSSDYPAGDTLTSTHYVK